MIVTDDLQFPEGPVLLPDGTWLVTEMQRGTVTQVGSDGSKREVASTGAPNGLAVRRDGVVWATEAATQSIITIDVASGDVATVLTEVEGVPLMWPNDVCVGPDGAIYATDSGLLRGQFTAAGWPDDIDGRVYRYDPATGEAWFIDRGLALANGLAFGPDGLLYVDETTTGNVFRYQLIDGRPVGERELFGNVVPPEVTEFRGGPDGMAFSRDGRLWVALFGYGEIVVLDREGDVLSRLPIGGSMPTNCAFGADGKLYVVECENGDLSTFDVGAEGFLHS